MIFVTVSGLSAWQEEKVLSIGATIKFVTYKNVKTGEVKRPAIVGYDKMTEAILQEVIAVEDIEIV